MKKPSVYIIVTVVVVIAGCLGWYLMDHKSSNNNTSSMNMNSSSSTNNSTATATNSVAIQNFAFSPVNVTVKTGATVTWTNKDSVAHTVTETDGKAGPDSGDVSPGSTYSFTFKTPGTYHYHCSIHSEMTGTIVVAN